MRLEKVELHYHTGFRNRYKVPKKAWGHWSTTGRRVFNEVYSSMRDAPWAFQSPKLEKAAVPPQCWKTTAWNAAWIAADAASRPTGD